MPGPGGVEKTAILRGAVTIRALFAGGCGGEIARLRFGLVGRDWGMNV